MERITKYTARQKPNARDQLTRKVRQKVLSAALPRCRSIALSGLGIVASGDPGAARGALAPGYLLPRLRRWLSGYSQPRVLGVVLSPFRGSVSWRQVIQGRRATSAAGYLMSCLRRWLSEVERQNIRATLFVVRAGLLETMTRQQTLTSGRRQTK